MIPPPSPVPTIAATELRCQDFDVEPHVVRVQRGRVPVVVVDHRQAEPFG